MRDGLSGRAAISRQHDDLRDAKLMELRNDLPGLGTNCITNRNQSDD